MRSSAWRILLAAALATVPAAASITVSPQSIIEDLAAGARKRVVITVTNELPVTRPLRYFAAPFRQRPDGIYEIVDEADTALSCHEWFGLDTVRTTLEANETRDFTIDITVPRSVTGTRFGAVVFDMLPSDTAKGSGGPEAAVGLVMRMPAFFALTVGGRMLRSRAELVDLKVLTPAELGGIYAKHLPPDALGIKALVRNTGPIRFEVSGHAVVRDSLGRRVKSFPLGSGSILPGAEVNLTSILAPLRRGRYNLEVAVTAGTGSPVKGSVSFVSGRQARVADVAQTVAQLDVSASPERLEMNLPPRSTRTRSLVVRNESDRTVQLKATLAGLEGFIDGTLDQTESPEPGLDCRAWTTLDLTEFTLAPRAARSLRLTFAPPADVVGGRYGCVYIEQVDSTAARDGKPAPSLTVPLMITVDGEFARSAEIAGVAGDPNTGMALHLANTGAVHLAPVARVSIWRATRPDAVEDYDFESVGTMDLEGGGTVLPGDTVMLTGKYNRTLPEGGYKMAISVDCGRNLRLTQSSLFKVGKR